VGVTLLVYCPRNCSGKGSCRVGGSCACDPSFSGEDCSFALCPNNCTGRGDCLRFGNGTEIYAVCACYDTYAGVSEDCSVGSRGGGGWILKFADRASTIVEEQRSLAASWACRLVGRWSMFSDFEQVFSWGLSIVLPILLASLWSNI
jgi:hypothetical protein